jgi:hypothetical protein
VNGIDIPADFLKGSTTEFLPLINRTKGAFIPRTISRKPQKQAACFTGRTNGPLLESHDRLHGFHVLIKERLWGPHWLLEWLDAYAPQGSPLKRMRRSDQAFDGPVFFGD